MNPDLVVRSHRVVSADRVGQASIHIRSGKIVALGLYNDVPSDCPVYDAGESVVMPGLVDTHVHINEPGRTEWEGFASATRAAAAGGVTTLIEMPLNRIPATTPKQALEEKVSAAQGQCHVDAGFWGGVVPGNSAELRGLYQAGAFGFKCFLVPSGVPEFVCVTEADLRAALPELAALGAVLLAHSEVPGPIEEATAALKGADPKKYSTWLRSRPREAENQAIELLIGLSREFKVPVHIVHLSSSDALPAIRRAKEEGVSLTVETCPHYLTFAAEEIPDGATEFKCAPPLREEDNREMLWAALEDGLIDFVATDHSPCPPEMKGREAGDFLQAWGGISSLQLGLPAMWTQARQRGSPLRKMTEWLCRAPARLAGLEKQKGAIAVGYDADLVVWKPETGFVVEPEMLHHRHKLTPYLGRELYGKVQATFLRGKKIYSEGDFLADPAGTILKRR